MATRGRRSVSIPDRKNRYGVEDFTVSAPGAERMEIGEQVRRRKNLSNNLNSLAIFTCQRKSERPMSGLVQTLLRRTGHKSSPRFASMMIAQAFGARPRGRRKHVE